MPLARPDPRLRSFAVQCRALPTPRASCRLTHWWITGGASTDFAIISLYIDGETTPSLSFQPNLACGVGFNDDSQVCAERDGETGSWR